MELLPIVKGVGIGLAVAAPVGPIVFVRSRPAEGAREHTQTLSGYFGALILTLTNPPTIISFAAIFTVLAPASGFDAVACAQTVAGVFLGSSLWWLALTLTVKTVRHAVGRRAHRIDGVCAVVLSLLESGGHFDPKPGRLSAAIRTACSA